VRSIGDFEAEIASDLEGQIQGVVVIRANVQGGLIFDI